MYDSEMRQLQSNEILYPEKTVFASEKVYLLVLKCGVKRSIMDEKNVLIIITSSLTSHHSPR